MASVLTVTVCPPYQARHLGVRTESPHAETGEGGREENILWGCVSQTNQFLLVSPEGKQSGDERPSCLLGTQCQAENRQGDGRTSALSPLSSHIIPSLLSSDMIKSPAPPWSVTSGCLEPLQATIIFINRPANAHCHPCRSVGC